MLELRCDGAEAGDAASDNVTRELFAIRRSW
jgi:hypothetical protein